MRDVRLDAEQRLAVDLEIHLPLGDGVVTRGVDIAPQALHTVGVGEARRAMRGDETSTASRQYFAARAVSMRTRARAVRSIRRASPALAIEIVGGPVRVQERGVDLHRRVGDLHLKPGRFGLRREVRVRNAARRRSPDRVVERATGHAKLRAARESVP